MLVSVLPLLGAKSGKPARRSGTAAWWRSAATAPSASPTSEP